MSLPVLSVFCKVSSVEDPSYFRSCFLQFLGPTVSVPTNLFSSYPGGIFPTPGLYTNVTAHKRYEEK